MVNLEAQTYETFERDAMKYILWIYFLSETIVVDSWQSSHGMSFLNNWAVEYWLKLISYNTFVDVMSIMIWPISYQLKMFVFY